MLIEEKEGAIFILSSGKITPQPKTHGNPNNTFCTPKTSPKTIKTDTTFTEKPHPFAPNQLHMPHITKLNLSKENIFFHSCYMITSVTSSTTLTTSSKIIKATPPISTNNYLNGSANPLSNYSMPITVNTDSYSNKRRTMTPSCHTPREC